MPKYAGRKRATYSVKRRSYRRTTTKRPYGNRYGNDAFVKIEAINNLAVSESTAVPPLEGEVYSTMRVDQNPGAGQQFGNTYLTDQGEFVLYANLYARYEVVGMKAEVTLNARRILTRSNLAGGMSPYLPNPAEFPALESHLSYPLQKDLNT